MHVQLGDEDAPDDDEKGHSNLWEMVGPDMER